jgi:AmiR/NasT family two-component response regulator
MLERAVPLRRVLIGNFGVIARMGFQELLAREGLEVLGAAETAGEIIPRLTEARPDVVLLDLDAEDAPELAAQISDAFPATTVIACSCEEPIMRVFPPFHYGESYTAPFTRVLFAAALKD